ncbi:MAG: hypothetical protein OHK93_003917 [Ramalina farinacea]|uniref:Ubiquitin-like protease family profile domain-containing protein n=1 Tax=Ramalina farinacea TaxID=258253 RepID=A0AA43QFR5_9LECA|nr:hypothetical protein [Ramalina farinacea]
MESYFRNKRDQIRPRKHSIDPADESPEEVLKTDSTEREKIQPQTKIVSGLFERARRRGNVEKPTNSSVLKSTKEGDKTTISALLDDLRPQAEFADRSSHLRRSARKAEIPPHLQDALFEDLNEADVPKYSKTHGLGKAWKKPLTFPKTGKKRATVDFADLERLDEGEMLNDSLVAFHMRYLEHSLEQKRPAIAKRIYFFSTFFYERLTDLPRGQKEINYAAVQKWTRNVDLFGYDYVVVPVNQNFHWYLAIICNLPAINREFPTEEDASSSTDKEALTSSPLTSRAFDKAGDRQLGDEKAASEEAVEKGTRQSFAEMSLEKDEDVEAKDEEMLDDQTGSSYSADKGNADALQMIEGQQDKGPGDPATVAAVTSDSPGPIRKQKKRKSMPPVTRVDPQSPLIITLDSLGGAHGNTIKHLKQYLMKECQTKRGGTSFDPTSIKGINAKEIPQQNNFADCGIFMLGYLEMFMNGDPKDFIAKTIRWSHTKQDWSELVPSKMRSDMRKRLLELGHSQDDENRTTKKERRSSTTTPHESDPTTPTEPHQAGVDFSKPPSKPSSSRNSPSRLPQPSTKREALETAQPIGPTLANGNESRSSRPPNDEDEIIEDTNGTSQDEPSLVVIENPNKDQEDMEQPSSQLLTQEVPGPATQRAMSIPPSPKLPSQVADSQDPPPNRQEDPPAQEESQELPMMIATPAVVIPPPPSKRPEQVTAMVSPAIIGITEKRHMRDFGHLQRSTTRSPPNVEDDRDFAPLPVSEKRRLKQYHKKGQFRGSKGHEYVAPVVID